MRILTIAFQASILAIFLISIVSSMPIIAMTFGLG